MLRIACFVCVLVIASSATAQERPSLAASATPVDKIKVLKDFRVELLYSVPKEKEGSWVSLCNGPNGTLIACDQGGGLYRITPRPVGQVSNLSKKDGDSGQVENLSYIQKIPVDIGQAQGLLWANGSLYVMVNGRNYQSGLYRVTDSDGDGELDKVVQLRQLNGGGEHGPHAIVPHPDGKSLVVLHGNQTKLTELAGSRVPRIWGEDHLLPRMPDGRGFMAGVLGPGGAIYKIDPEGKNWELLCVGYRNQYDMAFNKFGDLFTYDADMEWDFNTPWYRPTRVCLVASGADYGWRNGTGKWPQHYPDSLPSVVDIGPGSPTGIAFGYGAKFPAKYQDALYICDWSYGKMYAVHMAESGAGYTATVEEFVAGAPLPLTDLVVHPDGSLYFAIGGRNTQSGLYRVTYVGSESTDPPPSVTKPRPAWTARQKLEEFHGRQDANAVEAAWPHLDSPDRYLRYAARVAIEHQDVATWRDKALAETKPTAAINALLALVRVSAADPFHKKEGDPAADPALRKQIVESLSRIEWDALENWQRLELLRVYQVLFNRFGPPNDDEKKLVLDNLNEKFPAGDRLVNGDLCQLLVYLEAPEIAPRTIELLASAPTQEEQIEYAKALRVLKTGWTPERREQYFSWFLKAGTFKGGMSFAGFMNNIKKDAVALLSDAEKEHLKPILEARPAESPLAVSKPRPLVKKRSLDDVMSLVEGGLKDRDFDRGRRMFGAANCFACHRFGNEGGANGPDLTGIAGRFSTRDLLETIVEPSKVISDQYAAVVIQTVDGQTITGRIINLHGDTLHINTDMLAPGATVNVNRREVVAMKPSAVSMMPAGLLDTLHDDELLDLVAFLLSRGERKGPMFK
ncbi:MAG TPA: c-type cytochrome [Pirellulaceae bacterium]|nr:c-type cytochrome [Pirellulaceae bacterium]